MAATQKDPVLVVVQLSGGNDYLNTVIPYNNGLYRDNRRLSEIRIVAPDKGNSSRRSHNPGRDWNPRSPRYFL